MKSASCCNECWFFQRKLSTLPNGEKHFHAVRQFPSQALLGIQHTVPVIFHSSPHFVFEFFPSAVLEVGSKSCILTVQEILHILGHLMKTLLPTQSSTSGRFCLSFVPEPEEAERHFLSREIVWHLRQEHYEEISVLEGSHPHSPSTALDSAELDLQISVSDLPQPLRTDGF